MAYQKPTLDETGVHLPLYTEVRDELLERARRIFGADVYLEPDSQDYQLICAFAEMASDLGELAVLVYNNRSPVTAVGTGLDSVVKINGLTRKSHTRSACSVILTGDPGAKIQAGIVADESDGRWDIGDAVIPATGEIEVTATCQTPGPVAAAVGSINRIVTQQKGWLAVSNLVAATPGQKVESDAELRARQAISTAGSSKTILEGILGGVAALPQVTRYKAYENDGNEPDANGLPPHSSSFVVEGGEDREIAGVIYRRKTPGSGTYGDVSVEVEQSSEEMAKPAPIRFFRPHYVDVFVRVEINRRAGYVTQTAADIAANVCDYLNSIQIGENLTVSALYVPAMAAAPNLVSPSFSIRCLLIGAKETELSAADLEIRFNEVTRGRPDHIQVVVA